MKVGVGLKEANKGFALVEVIITLAIIVVILTMVLQLLTFGQETFKFTSNYIEQQYVVTNTIQQIRGDIQTAASVEVIAPSTIKLGYYSTGSNVIDKYKYWQFNSSPSAIQGTLRHTDFTTISAISLPPSVAVYDTVSGLDVSQCYFERSSSNPEKLVVSIMPTANNTGKANGKNLKKPIITEYFVLYKNF